MKKYLIFLFMVSCSLLQAVPADLLKDIKPEINFPDNGKIEMTWSFDVKDPADFASLTLEKPLEPKPWTLNGKDIPFPLKAVAFTEVVGIPPSLLQKGQNILKVNFKPNDPKTKDAVGKWAIKLNALSAEDLAFSTGPVLGLCGKDYFTVSCRTNMPAKVTAVSGGETLASEGLFHFFKFSGLKPDSRQEVSISASVGNTRKDMEKFSGRTLPDSDKFMFIALGDSRSRPEDWEKVTNSAIKHNPSFVLHSGDLVADGNSDPLWNKDLFNPGKKLFSTTPFFPVLGNHEGNSEIFHRLFIGEGKQLKNWTAVADGCLFIGINGDLNWTSGSDSFKWLENILSASNEKFIFFITHYPPWSSGPHGSMTNGKPNERQIAETRYHIMPLLKKYNATVLIAGHDHFYERSEPEDGITVIISGGAGAPRYAKSAKGEEQNPWSKAFSQNLNYCIFEVKGDICNMTAMTPAGEKIDEKQFSSRKTK